MAFWHRFFKRQIPTGRATSVDRLGTLSPYRSRTTDILKELRRIPEEAEAIDFLRKKTPDVSMAGWNFIRLANQGHTMEFYDKRGNRMKRAETKWREFAERVNAISNSGMDGLIDQIHASAFFRGAMGVEVEVDKTRTDVVDVYPIIPQTVEWELEERDGRKVWIPYQQQGMKKVSLENANFFWVPVDPDIDDPRGNLAMTPVLWAIDFQLQILQDLQAVLHHQGWPRNDIEIDREAFMKRIPPEFNNNPMKQREWFQEEWRKLVDSFKNLKPDSDYIHFDDMKVNMQQGANAGRSLDVRAIDELVSVQVLNGLKQMGILTNRVGGLGQTESWGSITFKIFCDGIASIQRGSKRLMEEIARLWLRVNGMQGTPVFTHNVVDWENEEQRYKVKLMKQEFYAIAQLMKWIDGDVCAQEVMGAEKAVGEPEDIRVSFSMGGNDGVYDGEGELQQSKVLPMRRRDVRT